LWNEEVRSRAVVRQAQTETINNPARHAARATTSPWRLLMRFVTRFKLEYLLTFPSNHAWMILRRKYDAFTTDRAYDEQPSSWLGPLGWWADRRVLNYPLHVALRERLRLVTTALVEAIEARQPSSDATVRVLSAPCGLCRDIIQAGTVLRQRSEEHARHVEWHALDIDARGDVIPEARRRTAAAGLPVTFYQEDIFDPAGLATRSRAGERLDVVNCIGLATWLTLDEVERLARFFHDTAMRPGATLVIDNWARHEHSRAGEDLEIYAYYHEPAAFAETLTRCGFRIVRQTTTTNGACTVTVAEAR
jgi:hypothetical protein